MTVTFSLAPEVAKIGRQLLAKNHDSALQDERIEYLFRSEAATSNGRTVWGKARKVTGLNAFLASPDPASGPCTEETPDVEQFFVIEIAYDVWATLTAKQKIALVDHELSHLKVGMNDKGEIVLSLRAHDLEEFEDVVKRHGLWKKDVEHFAKVAADQLNLLEQGEQEEEGSSDCCESGCAINHVHLFDNTGEVTGEIGSPEERHLRAVRP